LPRKWQEKLGDKLYSVFSDIRDLHYFITCIRSKANS